jgi:hypothetical protein
MHRGQIHRADKKVNNSLMEQVNDSLMEEVNKLNVLTLSGCGLSLCVVFLALSMWLLGDRFGDSSTAVKKGGEARTLVLDNARVWAVALVIFGHFVYFNMGWDGQTTYHDRFTWLKGFEPLGAHVLGGVSAIRMPTVCFVSGYLSKGPPTITRVHRFVQLLLVPTLIWVFFAKPLIMDLLMEPSSKLLEERLSELVHLNLFHNEWYLQALCLWRASVYLLWCHFRPSVSFVGMVLLSCGAGYTNFDGFSGAMKFAECFGFLPYFAAGYAFPLQRMLEVTAPWRSPSTITASCAFVFLWVQFAIPTLAQGALPDGHGSYSCCGGAGKLFDGLSGLDHSLYWTRRLAKFGLEMIPTIVMITMVTPRGDMCGLSWIGPHTIYPFVFHEAANYWRDRLVQAVGPPIVQSTGGHALVLALHLVYAVGLLVFFSNSFFRQSFAWCFQPTWLNPLMQCYAPEETKQMLQNTTKDQQTSPPALQGSTLDSSKPLLVNGTLDAGRQDLVNRNLDSNKQASEHGNSDVSKQAQVGETPGANNTASTSGSLDATGPMYASETASAGVSRSGLSSPPLPTPSEDGSDAILPGLSSGERSTADDGQGSSMSSLDGFNHRECEPTANLAKPILGMCEARPLYPLLVPLYVLGSLLPVLLIHFLLRCFGLSMAGIIEKVSHFPNFALCIGLSAILQIAHIGHAYAWHFKRMQAALEPPCSSRAAEDSLQHVVVLLNYKEPYSVLHRTIASIAAQRSVGQKPSVVLACEERDAGAFQTFERLKDEFTSSFAEFTCSLHQLQPGEVAGKSSNENCAVRGVYKRLVDERGLDPFSVLITIVDADSILSSLYLAHVEDAFWQQRDGRRLLYNPPLNTYRNMAAANPLIQFFEMSRCHFDSFYPHLSKLYQPQSNYSLTLGFAREIDFWTPDNIPEDVHTLRKAQINNMSSMTTVPIGAFIVNDLVDGLGDRYVQAKRHMWGITEFAWVLSLYNHMPYQAWIHVLMIEMGNGTFFQEISSLAAFILRVWLVSSLWLERHERSYGAGVYVMLVPMFVSSLAFWLGEWWVWQKVMVSTPDVERPSILNWVIVVGLSPVLTPISIVCFHMVPTWDCLFHMCAFGELSYVNAPKGTEEERVQASAESSSKPWEAIPKSPEKWRPKEDATMPREKQDVAEAGCQSKDVAVF